MGMHWVLWDVWIVAILVFVGLRGVLELAFLGWLELWFSIAVRNVGIVIDVLSPSTACLFLDSRDDGGLDKQATQVTGSASFVQVSIVIPWVIVGEKYFWMVVTNASTRHKARGVCRVRCEVRGGRPAFVLGLVFDFFSSWGIYSKELLRWVAMTSIQHMAGLNGVLCVSQKMVS